MATRALARTNVRLGIVARAPGDEDTRIDANIGVAKIGIGVANIDSIGVANIANIAVANIGGAEYPNNSSSRTSWIFERSHGRLQA